MNKDESEKHPVARVFTLIILVVVMVFVASFGLEYLVHSMQPKPAIAESPSH